MSYRLYTQWADNLLMATICADESQHGPSCPYDIGPLAFERRGVPRKQDVQVGEDGVLTLQNRRSKQPVEREGHDDLMVHVTQVMTGLANERMRHERPAPVTLLVPTPSLREMLATQGRKLEGRAESRPVAR